MRLSQEPSHEARSPCWHEVIPEHWRNVVIVVVGLAEVAIEGPLTEL